jgi:hypothetical protein
MKPTGVTFTGLPNTGEGHLNRGDFLSFTHNPTTVTVKVPEHTYRYGFSTLDEETTTLKNYADQ